MPPRPNVMVPQPPKAETREYKRWRGVNQTDSRVAIEDDELYWMENAITVGKGAIQILPAVGEDVATVAGGIASLWGVTLSGNPMLIAVGTDGALNQITPGGVVTAIAPAGSVTAAAHVAMWQSSPVLIIDPVEGYASWDGTTYTVINAAQLGTDIAVFEGRVWIALNRTISYSAPTDYDNFAAADGGGSTIITDGAFQGNIQHIVSALEQLWIMGQSAVNAIANVQSTGSSPNVTTTFSNTNIVTNLGTAADASTIGYFRALAFLAPFGAYALSGVTPQKLSDKLDGLFPDLTLGNAPAAVAVVQSLPCLFFLVTYTGDLAAAGDGPIKLLLGFTQGKWFFAVQDTALSWITTLVVSGVQQAWGTDGTHVFQLFGADPTETETTYKIISKLYDFGESNQMKDLLKLGFEYQASAAIAPTLTADSELGSSAVTVAGGGVLIFTNASAETLIFTNAVATTLIFLASGLVLSKANSTMWGHYLGWTLTGTDRPYRVQAMQMEYARSRAWSTSS